MEQDTYQNAKTIYINADGGGSNGTRNRLWKKELQKFANEIGKEIHVSHFPPTLANGIKSNTGCFVLSLPTGALDPCLILLLL